MVGNWLADYGGREVPPQLCGQQAGAPGESTLGFQPESEGPRGDFSQERGQLHFSLKVGRLETQELMSQSKGKGRKRPMFPVKCEAGGLPSYSNFLLYSGRVN